MTHEVDFIIFPIIISLATKSIKVQVESTSTFYISVSLKIL
jgi:hypothetical protein